MVLTSHDKLNLIKDILNSHQFDGNPTLREYEQLFRSTNAIINNGETPELDGVLQAINTYSEQGMHMNHYDQHLNENMNNFNQWVQSLH